MHHADGTRTRRSWRKLHLGVDADTGQIVASALTTKDVDDGTQTDPLLDQIDGTIGSFTGDGAYDQESVCASVTKRHPEAAVIVPPRSSAVPSADAETAIGRWKQVIGDGLRSRTDERRATEVNVAVRALNRKRSLGTRLARAVLG